MTNKVNYEDLKKHVVSADLAEELEKAGFPQNTFFSWFITTDVDDTPRLNRTDENCPTCSLPQQDFEKKVAAPLASEIGENFPIEVITYRYTEPDYVSYMCKLHVRGDWDKYIELFEDDSEANVRAKMWLYLKTHHLLEEGK